MISYRKSGSLTERGRDAMKIGEAKQVYRTQIQTLRQRREQLTALLKNSDEKAYDRVELSRELTQVDSEYEQARSVMSSILERENNLLNMEASKQQGKAMSDAAEDMVKCLEIARRISSGGKVPAKDERKLMEYSHELYMAAKNMAFLIKEKKEKEYDSLWDDEEEQTKTPDAREMVDNMESGVSAPEASAEAPAEAAVEVAE